MQTAICMETECYVLVVTHYSLFSFYTTGWSVNWIICRSVGQPIIAQLCVIPGLRCSVNEIFALLGCYTA